MWLKMLSDCEKCTSLVYMSGAFVEFEYSLLPNILDRKMKRSKIIYLNLCSNIVNNYALKKPK